MKKHVMLVSLAALLMFVIGFAGSAFSDDTAAQAPTKDSTATVAAHNCAASCPKFIDANKDGVCDSMAVHHADGKCANMQQCKKDGRCAGNCKAHAAVKTALPAGCDPARCATMPNGCPVKSKSKACPGSK